MISHLVCFEIAFSFCEHACILFYHFYLFDGFPTSSFPHNDIFYKTAQGGM